MQREEHRGEDRKRNRKVHGEQHNEGNTEENKYSDRDTPEFGQDLLDNFYEYTLRNTDKNNYGVDVKLF